MPNKTLKKNVKPWEWQANYTTGINLHVYILEKDKEQHLTVTAVEEKLRKVAMETIKKLIKTNLELKGINVAQGYPSAF